MVPLHYYLVLSGILFACGVTGFLIKRNIITIFMSIELMLNGVNLSFVAFAAASKCFWASGVSLKPAGGSNLSLSPPCNHAPVISNGAFGRGFAMFDGARAPSEPAGWNWADKSDAE